MAKKRVPPPEDPADTSQTTTSEHCKTCGARLIENEVHECDPDQPQELKDAIDAASVDLSAETAELKPQDQRPAVGGVVASVSVSKDEMEAAAAAPPGSTWNKVPLFDEPTFDAEKACHDIFRKTETVRLARSAYETAKEEASDLKKKLDTRSKELEDLIKELQWKEQRALNAKQEPKLVEASDGVEGVGELPTEDPLDIRDEESVDESPEGEGDEDGVGASDDADGDDEAAGAPGLDSVPQ